MNAESIHKWTRQQPFQPFRLKLTDGRAYDIRHPDMVAAGRQNLVVLGPRPKEPDELDEPFFLSYFHIVTIEPLLLLPAKQDSLQNGQHP